MSKYLKHNLKVWGVYTLSIFLISIIFLPIQGWNLYLIISLIFGFLFGILNEITSHLRKLTKDIKDDNDDKIELIKG